MSIIALQEPLPVLVSSGALAAGATLQNGQCNALGYSRIVGHVFSSAAPAAGYPRVTQSADGVTVDRIDVISQDTGQTTPFVYAIDIPIYAPYVSVQVQDAGAGSTVRVATYAVPISSPISVTTNTTVNPTYSTIPSYTACFNGLAAPIGQFFELCGGAGKVVRIRSIYIFKPNNPIEFKALKQSVASTGGTSTTTNIPNDSNNAASTGTAKQYTVAPTPGTATGNMIDVKSVTAGDALSYTFGDTWDQPIVIRAGQSLAFSTDVAFTCYGFVIWCENSS